MMISVGQVMFGLDWKTPLKTLEMETKGTIIFEEISIARAVCDCEMNFIDLLIYFQYFIGNSVAAGSLIDFVYFYAFFMINNKVGSTHM